MNPAVVVIAYQRAGALQRLLRSLDGAVYPEGAAVPLVISIDRGATGIDADVAAVAGAFDWRHGPREIIERPARLGLVEHFRACGDLTREHGDVILLEDDLEAGPAYYEFARRACDRYRDDERVAGTCLYGLWFNGFTHDPFVPVDDGSDVFFLQLPYTQGLAFTAAEWQRLTAHRATPRMLRSADLHRSFRRFAPDEWFPALASYLAATGRYFCFPRVSLVTGWGDAGAHFDAPTSWLHTPMQLRPREYVLPGLDESLAVYDSFYELLPSRLRTLGADLPLPDFDVDLNATRGRANLHHDHVLTTRPARRAIKSYGLRLRPLELNVVEGVPGDDISLASRDDVCWDWPAGLEARRRLHLYHWARLRPSRRRHLLYALAGAFERLRAARQARV